MRDHPIARTAATAPTAAAAAVLALLVLAACGTQSETPGSPAEGTAPAVSLAPGPAASGGSPAASDATLPAGAYLSRAEYTERAAARAGTKVVYFFHASWCPTCRATEQAISRDGIPVGLTVVKVDFDTELDLRKQYGVTTQHTFVQVDPSGAELAKWTGSLGGAEILEKTV